MAEACPTLMPSQQEEPFIDPTLTECPICLEQFRNPKSLPCLHTFCYECLHAFIQKHVSDTKSTVTEFPCPICRRNIKPEDASENCSKWTGQFPTQHLITAILEMKSVQGFEKYCILCKNQQNKEQKAELWCKNCNVSLCVKCREIHDVFNSGHSVFTSEEIQNNPTKAISITVRCEKHEEVMKLFCQDHKVLCCSTCVAVEHRKCDTVITVKEQVKKLKEGRDTAAIMSGSSQEIESLDSLLKDSEASLEELSTDKQNMSEEVNYMCRTTVKHLDCLERDFTKYLTEAVKKEESRVKERISDIRSLKAAIEQSQNQIKAAEVCQDDAHLVMAVQEVLSERQIYQKKCWENVTNYRMQKISIEVNKRMEAILNVSSVAKVCVKTKSPSPDEEDATFNPFDRYNNASLTNIIRIASDKISSKRITMKRPSGNQNLCRIKGAVCVQGCWVAVDSDMEMLYCFSAEGKLRFDGNLKGKPWDACNVDGNIIAVTLSEKKCISLVEVCDSDFLVTKEISVGFGCFGIAYRESEFLVTCPNNSQVLLLLEDDQSYLVQNSVSGSDQMWHAAAVKGSLGFVVSDRQLYKDKAMLHRLNEKKELQSFFADDVTSGARGLDADNHGNIYVCATDSNHVLMVSPTGQRKILLSRKDDISHPCAIAVCGDRMAVFEENSANGKIFQLLP